LYIYICSFITVWTISVILVYTLVLVSKLFLTTPFFGNRKAFAAVFGHFSLRMRRFGIIYASGPKSFITFVLSDIDFL